MSVKGIVFDLDGTLLDTIEDLTDAMNMALSECGYPPRTVAECKHFVGEGVEVFVRRALPETARNDAQVTALVPRYRELYTERWHVKTRPYPGIAELLERLQTAALPVAVLSNKPDSMTKQAVAHFLPDVSFAAVQGATPSVPLKPDPTSALAIASELKVEPRQFCYVGDTATDMRTAVAAGMTPVGVLWGFRDATELHENGARHTVSRPLEIADIVNNVS